MKIAVLVSGGVDSSVALQLLKNQGHDITAFYIKIWLEDELSFLGDCPWEEDLAFVKDVCKKVGVPLQVISLQREYWDNVVKYTISEIAAGRTPNPDILCNSKIKFGVFLDHLDSSYDKIATGHYAQIIQKDSKYILACSPDPIKDQTYFLSHLTQDQLSKCLFPIGHLKKSEVRQLAQNFDLPNKDRKDSQGVCFLGKFKFKDFIKAHLGTKNGDLIESETGAKMGSHEGFWFYTIGQRQGLGLPGGPWYVVDKDIQKNIIFISKNYNIDKPRNKFQVGPINWLADQPNFNNMQVKIRHGENKYNCSVSYNPEASIIAIDKNDHAIAAGQFAAFYDGDNCLGSAMITKAL